MLTEIQIKQLKSKDKRYMVRDDRGLYLEVMPSGNKHWRLRYWEGDKERKLDLGAYPVVSLKEARLKRDEININREKGISPRVEKKAALTFEEVAREWHSQNIAPSKSPQYTYKVISRLERFLFPQIGKRPISELTALEILTPLRAIEAQGMNETAHTVRQIAGQVFRFAVVTGAAASNPIINLQGALAPVVVKHRAAITDPRKVKDLILAMDAFDGSVIVKAALWFSVYTFQRPGEIRGAAWSEIDFDASLWRIPDKKMKEREPHLCTLSKQAVEVLQGMKPLTGHGEYVFPTIRNIKHGDRPMSENTITAALRRLGFGQDEMCAHGFRGMASTILNEQGWPPDVIERALAHAEGNSVRAAYNSARWLPQRREMMQHWADWLDGLKG